MKLRRILEAAVPPVRERSLSRAVVPRLPRARVSSEEGRDPPRALDSALPFGKIETFTLSGGGFAGKRLGKERDKLR